MDGWIITVGPLTSFFHDFQHHLMVFISRWRWLSVSGQDFVVYMQCMSGLCERQFFHPESEQRKWGSEAWHLRYVVYPSTLCLQLYLCGQTSPGLWQGLLLAWMMAREAEGYAVTQTVHIFELLGYTVIRAVVFRLWVTKFMLFESKSCPVMSSFSLQGNAVETNGNATYYSPKFHRTSKVWLQVRDCRAQTFIHTVTVMH